jgi:hypothetical protein
MSTLLGVRKRSVDLDEMVPLGSVTVDSKPLLEALRRHGPFPVIDLASHKHEAAKAFSLLLLSPSQRAAEIEAQAWSLWWSSSESAASPAVRALVRSLNAANVVLNEADDTAKLFASLKTVREAFTNPHPVVQYLVGGFESVRMEADVFLNACRTVRKRQRLGIIQKRC